MYFIDIAAVDLQFSRKRELASADEIVFFELMSCVGVFSPVRLLQRRERNGKRREQAEGRRQNKMQTSSHLKIMMRRSFEDDDSEDEEGTSWSKSLMPFMQGGCG